MTLRQEEAAEEKAHGRLAEGFSAEFTKEGEKKELRLSKESWISLKWANNAVKWLFFPIRSNLLTQRAADRWVQEGKICLAQFLELLGF